MTDLKSNIDIPIVYEDDDVLVVDKPSGLVVHSDGRTNEPTLVDWLLATYPEMKNVGEPWTRDGGIVIPRPGIVHRLDRETSGALVVAKTQASFAFLKQQFQERAIKKTYRTFVYGALKERAGSIERPIGKSKKDFRLRSAQPGARGELRDAVTVYTVVQRGKDADYVEVRPRTGRTHQIRVHFKAIHHPVVCDHLYAKKRPCILGFERLALHAHTLSFTSRGGAGIEVETQLPKDFQQALKKLAT